MAKPGRKHRDVALTLGVTDRGQNVPQFVVLGRVRGEVGPQVARGYRLRLGVRSGHHLVGTRMVVEVALSGVRRGADRVGHSAQGYLNNHPGANQVVTAAYSQPQPEAASNLRSYFTANPTKYYELRGILAPIGDTQRQCNVAVLPPGLATAYDEFMAG